MLLQDGRARKSSRDTAVAEFIIVIKLPGPESIKVHEV